MDTLTEIRKEFPFIKNNPNLIYFDSAATTLKPTYVLKAIIDFYKYQNANIHRSTHSIAEKATLEFELARQKIARFINADTNEIIFTYNASYAFNLLAQMLPLVPEDIVLGSPIEHHSNFLPWHNQANYYSLSLDEKDNVLIENLPKYVIKKAKYLAINYVSNVTGKVQNLDRLIGWARKQGIVTIIDASQAMCHIPIDVKLLDADYLIFSGHKMLGPSGVGILYGRYEMLKKLDPIFYGGGMAHNIHAAKHIYKPVPHCFEVGTPNIENIIGLGRATEFLLQMDQSWLHTHIKQLSREMESGLNQLSDVQLINPHREVNQVPIFSLSPVNKQLDVQMLARFLSDHQGILTTAGQQCAHPYYKYRQLRTGTVRISLNFYNTTAEVQAFLKAMQSLMSFLPRSKSGKNRKIRV